MSTLFAICAVLGGTVLVCQFFLTLLGLGGDHDVSGDHDVHLGDGGHDGGDHAHGHGPDPGDGHASSLIFGMLTFRTMTAAIAFFGLAGLAADAAAFQPAEVLVIALASGVGALFAVHHMMQLFLKLRSDGTVRLMDALEREGVVYLRVPARQGGHGKVHVILKEQTVELLAESNGGELPTGTPVRIAQFVGPDMVLVEPLARVAHQTAEPVAT
jgi:hypothetical protein